MIEYVGLIIFACFGLFGLIAAHLERKKARAKPVPQQQVTPVVTQVVDLAPVLRALQEVPGRVLNSIQSSTNTIKGNLAEHIAYLQLSAEYDRIVPLGSIVDFMCIKFPEGKNPGHVDFIDVKTGRSARLNKDQRSLQKLIEDKRINFRKLQISTVVNEDSVDGNSTSK